MKNNERIPYHCLLSLYAWKFENLSESYVYNFKFETQPLKVGWNDFISLQTLRIWEIGDWERWIKIRNNISGE